MQVSEVFKSCQGEGIRTGLPTIFVRLQGCNLYPNGCSYCDTKYAQAKGGKQMSVASAVKEIERVSDGCQCVCITGGEPLHQRSDFQDLLESLKFRDYYTEVFTNSTLEPLGWFGLVNSWVVDVKCPSSGVSDKCLFVEWLSHLRTCDQLKFVVADSCDLDYVVSVLGRRLRDAPVLISPMIPNCPDSQFGEVLMSQRKWLQTVWEFCVEHNYRFSFQTHKLVYGSKKGV